MFTAAAARHVLRREATKSVVSRAFAPATSVATRSMSSLDQYEDYGKNVFAGKVAESYLSKHGASADILKDPTWVSTHSDTVAQAVFDW